MAPIAFAVSLTGAGLLAGLGLALASARLGRSGAPSPARLALFAAGAAAVAAWAVASGHSPGHALLTAFLGWQLLLIAATDAEHFWLPDALTLPLAAAGLAASALSRPSMPVDSLIGAAFGFGLLWLTAFAYRRIRGREGLGGGDPFLLAAGGAWVGWMGLPSILLWAAASGLSLVLAMRLAGRTVAGDTRLPFGVFLAVGIWMTWVFGPLGDLSR